MVAVWFHCIIDCACHRYACTPVSLVCLHCMAHHTHTCTYFPGHGRWGRWLPGQQQLERCLYQPSWFLPRRQYQWTQSISTAVDPAKGKISCIAWRTKSKLWLSSAPFIGLVWQVLVLCWVLQCQWEVGKYIGCNVCVRNKASLLTFHPCHKPLTVYPTPLPLCMYNNLMLLVYTELQANHREWHSRIVAAFVVTKCVKVFGGERRWENNEGNHAYAVHVWCKRVYWCWHWLLGTSPTDEGHKDKIYTFILSTCGIFYNQLYAVNYVIEAHYYVVIAELTNSLSKSRSIY